MENNLREAKIGRIWDEGYNELFESDITVLLVLMNDPRYSFAYVRVITGHSRFSVGDRIEWGGAEVWHSYGGRKDLIPKIHSSFLRYNTISNFMISEGGKSDGTFNY